MLDWQEKDYWQMLMMETMNFIFDDHPKLLDFLFIDKKPQLSQEAEVLLESAKCFSSGEQILIRIALELWSGVDSGLRLRHIIEKLDNNTYRNVLLGLQRLRQDYHS